MVLRDDPGDLRLALRLVDFRRPRLGARRQLVAVLREEGQERADGQQRLPVVGAEILSTCPVTLADFAAPPISSGVTLLPMPTLTTGGPDMPMNPVPSTIVTKSDCTAVKEGPPKQPPISAGDLGHAPGQVEVLAEAMADAAAVAPCSPGAAGAGLHQRDERDAVLERELADPCRLRFRRAPRVPPTTVTSSEVT